MGMNIRKSIFETNSSSSHTVTYRANDSKDATATFDFRARDGVIKLPLTYYGWEYRHYNTPRDKLLYVLTYVMVLCYCEMSTNHAKYWPEDVYLEERKNYIREHINEWGEHASPQDKLYEKEYDKILSKQEYLKYEKFIEMLNSKVYPDSSSAQCWKDLFDLADLIRTHNATPIDASTRLTVRFIVTYQDFKDGGIDHQSINEGALSEWLDYNGVDSLEKLIFDAHYYINTGNDNCDECEYE
jgi:hypothetical protein